MNAKDIFHLLILLIISGSLISCDDDNKEKHAKQLSFSEINLKDHTKEQGICLFTKKDSVYTVSNKADLDKIAIYKNGDEVDFGIDYTKNTLLIIQGTSLSGISKINKTIVLKNELEYLLDIYIHQNLATVVESWTLILSIPKMSPNIKFTSNTQYGVNPL